MNKHRWTKDQTWGVTPGSGRPHGVDESWYCRKCGARKGRGPQSTCTGKRVIRWWRKDPSEELVNRLPECTG